MKKKADPSASSSSVEPRFKTLSFLSDFGFEDEFVGVTKSVIYEIAPFARIVDITHGIPPHNVRAGALALARSAAYLCPGVVLAVVDPGVGSNRRAIAIEVGGGTSVLLGPDNGLLAPIVALVGGPDKIVELTNAHYQLPQLQESPSGLTFGARDIFAPAAGHILKGLDIAELGPEVDPNTLTPQIIPVARKDEQGNLTADILWIDQFGNAQLNLESKDIEELTAADAKIQIHFKDIVRTINVAQTYSDLKSGELGMVIDSYGLAAIVTPQASAAVELGLAEGDEVSLSGIKEIPLTHTIPLTQTIPPAQTK